MRITNTDGRYIDQIATVLSQLKRPDSSSYYRLRNVGELDKMALARTPFSSVYVADAKLLLSALSALLMCSFGSPFNIARLRVTGARRWRNSATRRRRFYPDRRRHAPVTAQLAGADAPFAIAVNRARCRSWSLSVKPDSLFDYRFDDFEIEGYDPHPGIKRRPLSTLTTL